MSNETETARPAAPEPAPRAPLNGTMLQGFSWYLPADGTHWRRIAEQAASFAYEGITAVWLPPAYKGEKGASDVGYGVYDTYDLGEFDQKGSVRTKYGTRAEYEAAVAALHESGIQALADVVLNQRLGADGCEEVRAQEVLGSDRDERVGEPVTIDAWTRFDFAGRAGAYSDFRWDWTCFHGVDWDERTRLQGVFLFEGKHWDDAVDRAENGNYDYLMGADVDVNDPRVYEELVRWGKWYVDACGLDGFRLDALKHIDRGFYLRWLSDVRAHAGRELFCVGEYWARTADELLAYLGDERAMSLFDVPLHYNLYRASCSNGDVDLSRIFEGTLVERDPVHAVTFAENHDTQPGQALQSFVQTWFKPAAYALILLREAGYPCVFYGDLYGMPNDGNIPAVTELPLLMEIRRRFAYGPQHDFLDAPDVIGWTREGDDAHPGSGVAVVLTDRDGGEKRLFVGARHAGERWGCVIGEQDDVEVDADGWATFRTLDGRLSVYLPARTAEALEHDPVLHAIRREIADDTEEMRE
ncbi:alpha-amylase [Thermophilibacter sp.]